MDKYAKPLYLVGMILTGLGMLVNKEITKRETEELVEKVIARREEEKKTLPE